MNEVINVTFNELTVKKFVNKPDTDKYKSWNTSIWVCCECSCGKSIDVPLYGVTSGLIKSCGHLRAEKASDSLARLRQTHPNPRAIYLTFEDKTMNISEWSKETGIPRTTIMYRMEKNMPIEKILERKNSNE